MMHVWFVLFNDIGFWHSIGVDVELHSMWSSGYFCSNACHESLAAKLHISCLDMSRIIGMI
jgi:hypothetical protein